MKYEYLFTGVDLHTYILAVATAAVVVLLMPRVTGKGLFTQYPASSRLIQASRRRKCGKTFAQILVKFSPPGSVTGCGLVLLAGRDGGEQVGEGERKRWQSSESTAF